jgi:TolB protein
MPSVSPRGDRVAFMSDSTNKWEVYVVNIDGSGRRQLTDSGGYNSGLLTWSPDGSHIAFVSDRGNQWAIWVMKSDGSEERKLFDLGGTLTWAERISWAP